MAPDHTDRPPEEGVPRPAEETPSSEGGSLDPGTLDAMRSADLGGPDNPIRDDLLTEDALGDDRPVVPSQVLGEEPVAGSVDPEAPLEGAKTDALSAPMTQEELDALVADQASGPRGADSFESLVRAAQDAPDAPVPESADASVPPDRPLSQDELDRLAEVDLAEGLPSPPDADAASEPVPDTGTEEAPPDAGEDAALSQADLDALIAAETEGDGEAAAETEQTLSQEDLDALIAAESAGGEEAAAETEQTLSQADLDALIAAESAGGEEATEETEQTLSQADLDALIAAESAGGGESAAEAEQALSQEDLDALIAAETAGGGESAAEAEQALSQEDLDALIAAETAGDAQGAPAASEPVEEEDAALTQDALDALIAEGVAEARAQSMTTEEEDEEPEPAPSESEDEALSQDAIDALLSGTGAAPAADAGGGEDDADAALGQDDIDALLAQVGSTPGGEEASEETTADAAGDSAAEVEEISQTGIDDLIASLGVAEQKAEEGAGDDADEEVSQDMVDAILASAGGEKGDVGAENLAAAGSAPASGETPPLLSQSDLDAILEQAQTEQAKRNTMRRQAIEAALAGKSAPPPPKPPTPPGPLHTFLAEHGLRLTASVAAALVAGFGTFAWLWLNTERIPDYSNIRLATADTLELAMEKARAHMDSGEFGAAAEVLRGPIAKAAPGSLRDDARYLELEARCRGLRFRGGGEDLPGLIGAIDGVVASARNHPRAPEALYWKAKLYELDALPRAASDVYSEIISYYPNMPRLDDVLMDASSLAMQLGEPLEAARYARTLVNNFPGSRHYSEARLAYGDANQLAGSYEDARTLYLRVARAERDTKMGAEAFLRLGQLAFSQRDYQDAAMQLETRLSTATTSEGNDGVYLLLAQAYRKLDRLADARHALNDLLSFYPNSPVAPDAYIELSQVQDDMGEGEAALSTANRAAVTYPDNPRVLRNKGELLGRHGHAYSAALALMDADRAGASDPGVLLMAARFFRTADMAGDARKAYEKLAADYGDTGQALTGNVELAQLLYGEGVVGEAVDRLEDLAQATLGSPRRLEVMLALSEMYRDLGLDERVTEIAREVVEKAEQPEDLAQAATALLAAGDVDAGMEALERVDLARVKDRTAYGLLNAAGAALLPIDPRLSLRHLEDAYLAYPRSRTLEDDRRLLDAYLMNNRAADARRMVVELEGHVDEHPEDAAWLVDAAIALGDHQFAEGAYRTAADTYGMAIDAAGLLGGATERLAADPRWAVFQRANALLELSDYQGSLPLYAQIADSDAPWAAEAGVKAEYARLQQKVRGGGSDVG